jgi:hypothetical protein
MNRAWWKIRSLIIVGCVLAEIGLVAAGYMFPRWMTILFLVLLVLWVGEAAWYRSEMERYRQLQADTHERLVAAHNREWGIWS